MNTIDSIIKHLELTNERIDVCLEMFDNLNTRIERHDKMFDKVIRFMQIMPEYMDEVMRGASIKIITDQTDDDSNDDFDNLTE